MPPNSKNRFRTVLVGACTTQRFTSPESAWRPAGADLAELASWAHSAIDFVAGDESRECFFSMTGGHGTTGLWAWHAASEIGVHRLDVEDALGHDHQLSDDAAEDSATYACEYFLPAMRRVVGEDPGSLTVDLLGAGARTTKTISIESTSDAAVQIRGPGVQVLLALWGRPYSDVEVVGGDVAVLDGWRALPGTSFQFGAWD